MPAAGHLLPSRARGMARRAHGRTLGDVVRNPLGTKGAAAEVAIAAACEEEHPAIELFERVARPLRRVVPYTAGCWKPTDPQTLLFTGFGIEDTSDEALAAARWRYVDNEL